MAEKPQPTSSAACSIKHPFRSALDHQKGQQGWTALAEHAGHDALEAGTVRVDSRLDHGLAESRAATTAGFELEAELFDLVDRAVRPQAAVTRLADIKIDQSERVSLASGSRSGGGFPASVLGATVASLGLAWLLIGGLGSPFGLTSIVKLGAHRGADREGAAPPLPAQAAVAPAPVAEPKVDRVETGHAIVREPDQKPHQPVLARLPESAPAKSSKGPDLFSSTAMTRWKPSLDSSAPTLSSGRQAAVAQPHPPKMTPAPPQPEPRITTPVPETRPTTIEGWTLREIVNGAAVLDGPGGSFRVARGDTVPGVGRVLAIFRWGNRSMVATSKGLISTR